MDRDGGDAQVVAQLPDRGTAGLLQPLQDRGAAYVRRHPPIDLSVRGLRVRAHLFVLLRYVRSPSAPARGTPSGGPNISFRKLSGSEEVLLAAGEIDGRPGDEGRVVARQERAQRAHLSRLAQAAESD